MKKTTFKKLKPAQQALLLQAAGALKNAYNPYSHFSVGAAISTPDKKSSLAPTWKTRLTVPVFAPNAPLWSAPMPRA
jgi:hypothetical protein